MKYLDVVVVCLAGMPSYAAAGKPRAVLSHYGPLVTKPVNARPNGNQEATRGTGKTNAQVGVEQEERTWTNQRLEQLQGHGGISEFNQLPQPRAEVTREVGAEERQPGLRPGYDRLQDARWYSEHAAEIQSQLDALQLELVRYQAELQLVRTLRTMEAGLAFKQDTVGITPEAGIDVRIALLRKLRGQLEDLEDVARRNSIPPGVLR